MLIHLDSNSDYSTHPNNTPSQFVCSLPENYNLEQGSRSGAWHVALIELSLPTIKTGQKWDGLYICCSACESSCLGKIYKPIVASLSLAEIKRTNWVRFHSLQYVPLRACDLSELAIEICGKDGQPFEELNRVVNPKQYTRCTLSLKWMPNTSPWRP